MTQDPSTSPHETAPLARSEVGVSDAMKVFAKTMKADMATYLEACVRCGHCAYACHFHKASGDPRHTPAYKLRPLAKALRREDSVLGWLGLAPELTKEDLTEWEDLLFDSCTMCGRCTIVCPMGIDIASIVGVARQAFAAAGLGPEDLQQAAENAHEKGSPLGVTPEVLKERVDWLEDEDETDMPIDKEKADVLLTISSIEMMKYPESVSAMAKLLNAAGVDWTFSTIGYESTNFGYLAGKADIAKELVEHIDRAANKIGAKTVIIPECGHAYGVMRWTGANILGHTLNYQVLHITEYLAQLKRDGRLKFKPIDGAVTYHDPCQVSRRGGATEDARELLNGVFTDFHEMDPTKNYNWCCGGGGGVQAISRAAPMRHEVFKIKMHQVSEAGADTLISSCANCRLTMDDSAAHWKWDKKLESLVELLAENIAE